MIIGHTSHKELMFFCFDFLEDQSKTVAITCPRKPLSRNSFAKCCPPGKMILTNDDASENFGCTAKEEAWKVPINGHIYSSTELENKDVLVYEKDNRSKVSVSSLVSTLYILGKIKGSSLEQ